MLILERSLFSCSWKDYESCLQEGSYTFVRKEKESGGWVAFLEKKGSRWIKVDNITNHIAEIVICIQTMTNS